MQLEINCKEFLMTREMYSTLESWLTFYTLDHYNLNNLPKLGLTVYLGVFPVGVAFLRKVEGGKALVDSLIADPNIDPKTRDKCLDKLMLDLLKLAKVNDITGVFAFTMNKRTLERAKKLGFTLLEHKLVSKDL